MEYTTKKHSFFDTLFSLSPFEKVLVSVLTFFTITSATYIAYQANIKTFIEIPRMGGTYTEGIVGTPRFINPLLAISRADKDLVSVVYAGLLTRDTQGKLIPELVESYSVSEDGTVYTFTLKKNLIFHDKTPLTAEDVLFTVQQAANASVHSPLFANWDGVVVEKKDDRTIVFSLPAPYTPFLENLTLGILPSHIWSGLTADEFPFSQFNITPVGSGPYKVKVVDRDKSGIPTKYSLVRFDEYALGIPYIETVQFVLYNNDDDAITAYAEKKVDAINSIAPAQLETFLDTNTKPHTSIYRTRLLRVFGIFFNHNKQPIFLRDEVREALTVATPKKEIVSDILKGYGTIIDGPLPITNPSVKTTTSQEKEEGEEAKEEGDEEMNELAKTATDNIQRAQNILEGEGWKKNEAGIYTLESEKEIKTLSLSFSTVNTPELATMAERIAQNWRAVGAEVEVKVFEPTDLTQLVIRPRRFDTLLFGMVIGHELDLYAFWHSSQRNDPGLNIAQYADIETDSLLEKMRTEQNTEIRSSLYKDFTTTLQKNNTAIFLYVPDFIYIVNDNIHNVSIHPVADASERLDTIHTWNIETNTVWSFLADFFKA